MKFKKLLTLVAAGFLTLGSATTLASCGGDQSTSSSQTSTSQPGSNEQPSEGFTALKDIYNVAIDTEVKVEGVVSYFVPNGSGVNQGFFITDGSGYTVYIYGSNTAAEVSIGNKVQIQGTRATYNNSTQIKDVSLLNNDGGSHEISTSSTEISIKDYLALPTDGSKATIMYKITGTLTTESNDPSKYNNYYLNDSENNKLLFYSQNSGKEYAYLSDHLNQEITVLATMYDAKNSKNRSVLVKVL